MKQPILMHEIEKIDWALSHNSDPLFQRHLNNKALGYFVIFDKDNCSYVGIMESVLHKERSLFSENCDNAYLSIHFYDTQTLETVALHNHIARMHFSFTKSNPDHCVLELIYVKQSYSGKGIAQSMLQLLDLLSVQKNFSYVKGTLYPFDYCEFSGDGVKEFYLKSHYRVLPNEPNYILQQPADALRHEVPPHLKEETRRKVVTFPTQTRNFVTLLPNRMIAFSSANSKPKQEKELGN